ncbi:MAG: hypothetical protein WC867_02005 [Candidatus Pacearchaeota archaeon]|jgi:hypothetical protein
MKRSIIFLTLFLILTSTGYLLAQDNSTDDNSTFDPNNNTSTDNNNLTDNNLTNDNNQSNSNNNTNLTGPWVSRCNAVNSRVEGRLRQYNEEKDKHYTRFSKLSESLQTIITKADSRGFDTSALKEDQVKLNELIQVFQADYTLFIEKLANTRNFTCGHSEGQFLASLNESKNQLKVVKLDADAIKEFFQSTVKEDIKALKEQEKLAMEERKKAKEEERSVKDSERQAKVAEREVKRLEIESKLEARKTETQAKIQEREKKILEAKEKIESRQQKLTESRERVRNPSQTDTEDNEEESEEEEQ